MKEKQEQKIFQACTALGIASLFLTLADFFFLKKTNIYYNYKPISAHYGNELLIYYLAIAGLSIIANAITKKKFGCQAMLAWGINFAFFSNQYAYSDWTEGMLLIACLALGLLACVRVTYCRFTKKVQIDEY